ncbi:MAG: hypothetical protein WCI73_00690 [Phycisphaerae bacterium]
MVNKFKFYEVVRIIAVTPRVREDIIYKEGIIVGMSDPDDQNRREYGVHINEFGETFAVPEQSIESTGRSANRQDVISRKK